MTRVLKDPKIYTDDLNSEIVEQEDSRDSQLQSIQQNYDREITARRNRVSALETIREPMIGPGEMPFLISVEYFTVGDLREHGHIYGRTVRQNDSQVWTLYNDQGAALTQPCDWLTLVNSYLMKSNKSVRLHMPVGYEEFARHTSLDGSVDAVLMPEFAGKTVEVKPKFEPLTETVKVEDPAPSQRITAEQRGAIRAVVSARLSAGDVITLQANPQYRSNEDFYGSSRNEYRVPYLAVRDKNYYNQYR